MDKFEGALGKGKGRKWYAYKVMMTKASHIIQSTSKFSLILVRLSVLIKKCSIGRLIFYYITEGHRLDINPVIHVFL